jgi:uncharacterized DUF497 family protein
MAQLPEYFPDLTGFEWDTGNYDKNWVAHGVSQAETEQTFFNRPLLVTSDVHHSQSEPRYYVLGRTNGGRRLTIVFTVRGTLVRPIMARDMSRPERRRYLEEEHGQEAP